MKLTVQVVNYNSRNHLRECLDSLNSFLAKNRNNAEIIIINNDVEPIGSFLNSFPQSASGPKVIEISKNIGFGEAHNRGAKEAQGEYILFLNPDTKINAEALEEMLNIFEKDAKIGIVGPLLIDFEGRLQKECWGFKKSPLSTIKSKLPGNAAWRKNEEKIFEVDWVSGGAMMIRKKLLSELGGFDENYFMYFEDVDLCLQAKKRGWKIVVNQEAKVQHRGGKSFSSQRNKKRHYYASQNYYLEKNFGSWQAGIVKILRFPLYIKNIYFNKR
jgi:N-acetylglucosaminyl-diphospho-decaprenol L-rhamnosyltransferase